MKKVLAIALALCMALTLGASALASSDKITLRFTNFYTEEDVANNADARARDYTMKKYAADNADTLDIVFTALTQSDYATKIQAQAAADDMPELFLTKGSWVENFAENGLLADLTADFEKLPYKDDYYAGEFKSITYDGKILGVPIQFVSPTSLMFSNKAIWEQAGYTEIPKTFDEIYQAVPKMQELGVTTIQLGNKENWPYESCWISCLGDRFTGTEWFNSILARDGQAKFTDEAFVDMLRFTKELGASGVLNADFNSMTHDEAMTAYNQGKAASFISGYWAVANIIGNALPEVRENTVITLLPQPANAKGGDPNSLSNSSGWFVSVSSKLEGEVRDAAVAMAFAINGPEYCENLAKESGALGPIKVDMPEGNFDRLMMEYNVIAGQYASSGVPVYDVELNGAIVEVMNSGLQEVLAGTMEPEALAELIQAEQDALS